MTHRSCKHSSCLVVRLVLCCPILSSQKIPSGPLTTGSLLPPFPGHSHLPPAPTIAPSCCCVFVAAPCDASVQSQPGTTAPIRVLPSWRYSRCPHGPPKRALQAPASSVPRGNVRSQDSWALSGGCAWSLAHLIHTVAKAPTPAYPGSPGCTGSTRCFCTRHR